MRLAIVRTEHRTLANFTLTTSSVSPFRSPVGIYSRDSQPQWYQLIFSKARHCVAVLRVLTTSCFAFALSSDQVVARGYHNPRVILCSTTTLESSVPHLQTSHAALY
jgi:hypothetical protein